MAHGRYALEVETLQTMEMSEDRVRLLQMVFLACLRECRFHYVRVCILIPNIRFVRPPPLTPFGIPLTGELGGDRQNISGALMTQYLMALLGYQDTAMLGIPESGRMGDYVFNQEGVLYTQRGARVSFANAFVFKPLMKLFLRSWKIRVLISRCLLQKKLFPNCHEKF